ncbi:MAG: 5-formyltetrahydrofolate cyclo-ligase [Thermoguttaceae bacterium]|jgi:5-formyltetrahydrofolate cyclo-ligase|nr:5-formyltetrahydrofolate cyclo-ligase [Thermoguttaceae bacterium]
MDPIAELRRQKAAIRQQAEAARAKQPNKDQLSRAICRRFADLAEFAAAPTVMLYVDIRHEVRTREFIRSTLALGKRVVVPYCDGDELSLFHLHSLDELVPSVFGLLEPPAELRALPARRIDIVEVDLVMVPGVAFDRRGGRLGHGKGYYDRLLRRARRDTLRVGVAFECQVFPAVPMDEHDVPMDRLVTEAAVYARPTGVA